MAAALEHELIDIHDPDERELIRTQLGNILRSAHFRNSKRYPALLKYVVEATLEENTAQLKERVLGSEVFGRAPDYDTGADPIVRVTVAEIRKRIAQYYHEEAHATELRIELVPGSYVPIFLTGRGQVTEPAQRPSASPLELDAPHIPSAGTTLPPPFMIPSSPASDVPSADVLVTTPETIIGTRDRRRSRWLYASLIFFVVLLTTGGVLAWRGLRTSPQDQLWGPFFAFKGPVTFCLPISIRRNKPGEAGTPDKAIASVMDLSGAQMAASATGHERANAMTFLDHELLGENVVYSDVQAMIKLESVVEQQHRPVRVRLNLGTNLNELREGPTIFIGGLDNQWTLKLLEPLRYRFAGRDADGYYIQDVKAPEKKDWSVHIYDRYTSVDHDYAIIARVHGEELGETVLIAAGIGMTGTAAAGEFLSSPAQIAELSRRLGGTALRDRDFEAVLKTDVVNGIAGPAQILAVDVR